MRIHHTVHILAIVLVTSFAGIAFGEWEIPGDRNGFPAGAKNAVVCGIRHGNISGDLREIGDAFDILEEEGGTLPVMTLNGEEDHDFIPFDSILDPANYTHLLPDVSEDVINAISSYLNNDPGEIDLGEMNTILIRYPEGINIIRDLVEGIRAEVNWHRLCLDSVISGYGLYHDLLDVRDDVENFFLLCDVKYLLEDDYCVTDLYQMYQDGEFGTCYHLPDFDGFLDVYAAQYEPLLRDLTEEKFDEAITGADFGLLSIRDRLDDLHDVTFDELLDIIDLYADCIPHPCPNLDPIETLEDMVYTMADIRGEAEEIASDLHRIRSRVLGVEFDLAAGPSEVFTCHSVSLSQHPPVEWGCVQVILPPPPPLPEGWTALTSGIEDDLHDVDFVNLNAGWVVGEEGIFRTEDGGENWENQWSGEEWVREGGEGTELRAVAVDSQGSVIAAGYVEGQSDRDILLLKYDSGGTPLWPPIQLDFGGNEIAYSAAIGPENTVIIFTTACGDHHPGSLHKFDNGGNFLWSVSGEGWKTILGVGPDGAIYTADDSPDYTVWKYDENGTPAGSYTTFDVNPEHIDLAVDPEGNVVTVAGLVDRYLLQKYDQDLTPLWSVETSSDLGQTSTPSLAVDTAGNITVAFEYSTVAKYDPDGALIWERPISQYGFEIFEELHTLPGGEIIIADESESGIRIVVCDPDDGSLRAETDWTGLSGIKDMAVGPEGAMAMVGDQDGAFRTARRFYTPLTSVAFTDTQRGWAAGPGVVIGTVDGGQSWQPSLTAGAEDFRELQFLDTDTGFALSADELFRTVDGGDTWESMLALQHVDFRGVSFFDEDHGWVCGEAGVTLYTDDGGDTWSGDIIEGGWDLNGVRALSGTEAYAAGEGGYLAHLRAGWEPIVFKAAAMTLRDLTFCPDGDGWFCGYELYSHQSGNMIGVGPDGEPGGMGLLLQEIELENRYEWMWDAGFNALDFPGNRVGWMVGDDGLIWRYREDDGIGIWVDRIVDAGEIDPGEGLPPDPVLFDHQRWIELHNLLTKIAVGMGDALLLGDLPRIPDPSLVPDGFGADGPRVDAGEDPGQSGSPGISGGEIQVHEGAGQMPDSQKTPAGPAEYGNGDPWQ